MLDILHFLFDVILDFVISVFAYLSIHVSTDEIVLGNVLDKGRSLIVGVDVGFITGFETYKRLLLCRVAIK